MEWEVRIIEFIQTYFGAISKYAGDIFSFVGGENGLMVLIVVALFCWKKQVGQRLALIIASLHVWLSAIKSAVKRLRPFMEYPDHDLLSSSAEFCSRYPQAGSAHCRCFPLSTMQPPHLGHFLFDGFCQEMKSHCGSSHP